MSPEAIPVVYLLRVGVEVSLLPCHGGSVLPGG